MSQSAVWDTLQVARDARLWGAVAESEHLYAEVAPDCEYVRRTHKRAVMPFWFDDGVDEYDEPYEVESEALQRAAWRANVLAIDWLSWSDVITTTSIDSFMKEMYSEARIAEMAYAPNPFLSMVRKDSDAIEARLGSYADLIQPVAYGVFAVPGDDDA